MPIRSERNTARPPAPALPTTERARYTFHLGLVGHCIPPGIRWHFSLCPKSRMSRPGERPGAAAAQAGERPRGAGGPRALPPGTGGGRARGRRPPSGPAGHTGALPAGRTAAALRPRLPPAAQRDSRGTPAASSAPPSPQPRPDGDPVPATPGAAAVPPASPCRLGLRATRSAGKTFLLWHLHPAVSSTARPPHYPRPHTYARQAVRSAPRFSVGSRSAGGRGGQRGRSGGTEARGRRVPRPRG